MTIRKFINAMQNDFQAIMIYEIDPTVHISYDPENDTIFKGTYNALKDIPANLQNVNIQDFYIMGIDDKYTIQFFV